MISLETIGVTTAKAKQFAKKGIYSVEQLIRFLPRKYNDYSRSTGILPPSEESCIVVIVEQVRQYHNKTSVLTARCKEVETGAHVHVTWFQQNFLYNKINSLRGERVYVAGKVTYDEKYGNYSISMPSIFVPDTFGARRIYPVYSKISGMSEEYLTTKIKAALDVNAAYVEAWPPNVIQNNSQMSLRAAINELHFPTSMANLQKAQERMVFDDLLYFAMRIEKSHRDTAIGSPFGLKHMKNMIAAINSLPFQLTEDQKKALREMTDSMRAGKRINALLQGDVGSGKTIVAFLMMLAMADSGYQSALMAPTQVLARQHYDDLCKLVEPFGMNVVFIGGAKMKKAEEKELIEGLSSGRINMAVGTHALLNKADHFKALALTITDEEHKFGVIQRDSLIAKAAAGVHSISMSATPIPRSLAMVVYGNEIQLLTLKTPPMGRLPVKTAISSSFKGTFRFLCQQLAEGHQGYVVCPMIDSNEDMAGVVSVEETFAAYAKNLEPLGYKAAMLTGRNTPEETAEIIAAYKEKKIHVLVCTTVIEVGVNVPNATVIIIHNAERFGLSGLHQLRGRVGRGSFQSYCVLFSADKANERLNVMVSTTDGFRIAEEDLRIRGAGDFIGTKQSGDNKYINLMMAYPDKYAQAQKIASRLVDMDYQPTSLPDMYAAG